MNGYQDSEGRGITDLPENITAMLAALIPPVTGVTFWLLDRERALVRFYSMQNILLGIVATLCWMAVLFLGHLSRVHYGIFLLGPLLALLSSLLTATVGIVYLGLVGFQVWKAWKFEQWEIPFLGGYVRNVLAKN